MASSYDLHIADLLRAYQQYKQTSVEFSEEEPVSEFQWKLGFNDCRPHRDWVPVYTLGKWYFDENHSCEAYKKKVPEVELSDSDKEALIDLVMGVQVT